MAAERLRGEEWETIYSATSERQRPKLQLFQDLLSEQGIQSEIVAGLEGVFTGMDRPIGLVVPASSAFAAAAILAKADFDDNLESSAEWEQAAPWRDPIPGLDESEKQEILARTRETIQTVEGWDTEEQPELPRCDVQKDLDASARYALSSCSSSAARTIALAARFAYAVPVCAIILMPLIDPVGLFDIRVWAGLLLFLILYLLPLRWLAKSLENWAVRQSSHRRNKFARDLAQVALQGGAMPSFAVYLRPFDFDRTLKFRNAHHSEVPFAITNYLTPNSVDFETVIADALGQDLPLIGLGSAYKDFLGAGRVEVPDSIWRSVVHTLMAKAELIIMVPSPTKSTVWEMRQIYRQRLLSKVVFAYPNTEAASSRALETSAIMKELGLVQPVVEATDGVLLWKADYDGKILAEAQAPRLSTKILRSLLLEMNAPGLQIKSG